MNRSTLYLNKYFRLSERLPLKNARRSCKSPRTILALFLCAWVLSASAEPTPSAPAEPTPEKLFALLDNFTIEISFKPRDPELFNFLIYQIQTVSGSMNWYPPNFHVSETTHFRFGLPSLDPTEHPSQTVNLSIKEALLRLLSRSSTQLIARESDWYFVPAAIKIDQSAYTQIAPNVYLFKEYSTPARQDKEPD